MMNSTKDYFLDRFCHVYVDHLQWRTSPRHLETTCTIFYSNGVIFKKVPQLTKHINISFTEEKTLRSVKDESLRENRVTPSCPTPIKILAKYSPFKITC